MRKHFSIIFIFIILSGCRFSAPIVKFKQDEGEFHFNEKQRTERLIYEEDALKIAKYDFVEYKFIRFSQYGIFGGYSKSKSYDDKGNLIKIEKEWVKAWNIYDGTQRTKLKTIYYENGEKAKIDYEIIQAYGIAGWWVLDKTKVYHTNGTIEMIDRTDKNEFKNIKRKMNKIKRN